MEDQEILKKFRTLKTRSEAFNTLLAKYQQRVYWHVRKLVIIHEDADDLVQEVFIKVYKNLENFREASQLFTWIYRIATNECLGFLKKKKKRLALSLNDVSHELMGQTSAVPISGDEIQLKLQQALLKLPDKQRAVFNMKYFEDMKYDEISKITGTSVGALKASYHLAVKKIEGLLYVH